MNSEITATSPDAREIVIQEADTAAAVYEALAASPGATTAALATAAGTGKKEARRELLALEKAGTATRVKGGKPGVPDTWTLTAAPDEPEAPAAEPQDTPDEPASGDEPSQGADDTAEPGQAADEADSTPDPAAVAEATEQVVAIAKALADIGTALAEGNIAAALDGIEKVRQPASHARRILKAAAKGKRRPARSPGTGVRPGALRDLVQAHLYDNPDEEFTPHQISKTLNRSSGAVANALDRLVQLGIAVPTSEKPRRFQLNPDAPARTAPAEETGQPAAETADNPGTEPATGTVTEPGITADAA